MVAHVCGASTRDQRVHRRMKGIEEEGDRQTAHKEMLTKVSVLTGNARAEHLQHQ